MALFHTKFQSVLSLILFTLTDDPQLHGSKMSLNNVLIIGFFRSNNRTLIFSKTEKKKKISQQTRKGPYIYDMIIEVGWGRGLKI